jgi:SHS2 domain-containing protein
MQKSNSQISANFFEIVYNVYMKDSDKNIKFHENIAIADTAFTVKGKTRKELFENAAIALFSSMADISQIEQKEKRTFSLKNSKLDLLLFDFLNELLFYKDSENLLFSKFNVKILNSNGYQLEASVEGEKADPDNHKVTIDIKAVTMHMFKVEKTKDGYEARVVIDI